jgi:uncharacterized OB-fold protein
MPMTAILITIAVVYFAVFTAGRIAKRCSHCGSIHHAHEPMCDDAQRRLWVDL